MASDRSAKPRTGESRRRTNCDRRRVGQYRATRRVAGHSTQCRGVGGDSRRRFARRHGRADPLYQPARPTSVVPAADGAAGVTTACIEGARATSTRTAPLSMPTCSTRRCCGRCWRSCRAGRLTLIWLHLRRVGRRSSFQDLWPQHEKAAHWIDNAGFGDGRKTGT